MRRVTFWSVRGRQHPHILPLHDSGEVDGLVVVLNWFEELKAKVPPP